MGELCEKGGWCWLLDFANMRRAQNGQVGEGELISTTEVLESQPHEITDLLISLKGKIRICENANHNFAFLQKSAIARIDSVKF